MRDGLTECSWVHGANGMGELPRGPKCMSRRRCLRRIAAAATAGGLAGCQVGTDSEVVVYCALDNDFADPILTRFQQQSGILVRSKYDVESNKTVGLVNRLLLEGKRPRCDVFWNNEIVHTLRLVEKGLTAGCPIPGIEGIPTNYRSAEGHWYGLAARARVLLVHRELLPQPQWPRSIHDLVRPEWRGKVGIAKPLFGTTASHAAALFTHWGQQKATSFFRDLKKNVVVLPGNKQVAQAVSHGRLLFGLTDTDDAIIEREQGAPVEIVFPDQRSGEMGTLFIPNSLCVIDRGPNPQNARQLLKYLLSPEVETSLAKGPSGQFPVNQDLRVRSRVDPGEGINWMDTDFNRVSHQWNTVAGILRDLFAVVE